MILLPADAGYVVVVVVVVVAAGVLPIELALLPVALPLLWFMDVVVSSGAPLSISPFVRLRFFCFASLI